MWVGEWRLRRCESYNIEKVWGLMPCGGTTVINIVSLSEGCEACENALLMSVGVTAGNMTHALYMDILGCNVCVEVRLLRTLPVTAGC